MIATEVIIYGYKQANLLKLKAGWHAFGNIDLPKWITHTDIENADTSFSLIDLMGTPKSSDITTLRAARHAQT